MGWWEDLMSLEVFSKLNDSMISYNLSFLKMPATPSWGWQMFYRTCRKLSVSQDQYLEANISTLGNGNARTMENPTFLIPLSPFAPPRPTLWPTCLSRPTINVQHLIEKMLCTWGALGMWKQKGCRVDIQGFLDIGKQMAGLEVNAHKDGDVSGHFSLHPYYEWSRKRTQCYTTSGAVASC